MSDTPDSRALDALVDEAREAFAPPVGVSRSDDAMFRALEAEVHAAPRAQGSPSARRARGPIVAGCALLAAAAAAAVLLVVRDDGGARRASTLAPPAASEAKVVSALVASDERGAVRVAGSPAVAGELVRAGDRVEADGARALLELPGKVTWTVERDERASGDGARLGRATVTSIGETLVVALEEGAVEADVVPVASGEAFAVDVASGPHVVRVAVRGTHLRVARQGTRVLVDLTEGVVAIGAAPDAGETRGVLVSAPAHVELEIADPASSWKLDRDPGAVRAALPIGRAAHRATAATGSAFVRPPHSAGRALPPSVRQPAAQASALEPSPPTAPAARAHEEHLLSAIGACSAGVAGSSGVRVTVRSTLRLRISASGAVESAQFDPPLLPAIQRCAAAAVYDARFGPADAGELTLPIEFSY